MPPSEQLRFQAQTIHDLLANTSSDQLGNATPCAKWTVRDLLNHLVGGAQMFGSAFKGEPVAMDPDGPMPDMLGDDPLAAWDGAMRAFDDGVDSPGALDRQIALPFGTIPGAVVLEILKFDVLVHAWDLARGTNQAFDPPAEIVDPLAESARGLIAPEMRDGDTFAAEVAPPADATPIERLAAFTGRSV